MCSPTQCNRSCTTLLGLVIAIVRGIASRDTIQQAYKADKVKIIVIEMTS